MNDTATIELNEAERALLDQIDFSQIDFNNHPDRDVVMRSCAAAGKLMALLLARNAIPERRWRCFDGAEWGHRGKSIRRLFEEQGPPDDDIFEHPNFLKYLRFLIHGSDLPQPVIDAVRHLVGNPRYFSLSDAVSAGKTVRKLVRDHGLDARRADDFLHLCADLDLSHMGADSIRQAVRNVRS